MQRLAGDAPSPRETGTNWKHSSPLADLGRRRVRRSRLPALGAHPACRLTDQTVVEGEGQHPGTGAAGVHHHGVHLLLEAEPHRQPVQRVRGVGHPPGKRVVVRHCQRTAARHVEMGYGGTGCRCMTTTSPASGSPPAETLANITSTVS